MAASMKNGQDLLIALSAAIVILIVIFFDFGFGPRIIKVISNQQVVAILSEQLVRKSSNYQKASAKQKPKLLSQLLEISQQRKESMLTLIKESPKDALGVAFDDKARSTLPEAIQSETEQPVTLSGRLEILHADNFEQKKSKNDYFLESFGKRYQLHPTEDLFEFGSTNIEASGVKIADQVAIDSETVKAGPVQGEVAGALDQTVLVIILNSAISTSTTQNVVFGAAGAADFYQKQSYGKMNLSGKVVSYSGVSVPGDCDISRIETNAKNAAISAGENLSSYARLIIIFPQMLICGFSGAAHLGSVLPPGPSVFINGSASVRAFVVEHELGHSFGSNHANSYDCFPVSIKTTGCISREYEDGYDVMGGGTILNGFHKERMLFFDSGNIQEATGSGTYTLKDYRDGTVSPKVLKVPRDKDANGGAINYLYFIYQPRLYAVDGVLINYAQKNLNGGDSQLIKAVPAKSFGQAVLLPGERFEDTEKLITAQIASLTSSQVTLDIQITPPTGCQRLNPIVGGTPLTAWGEPGETVSYNVTVTNRDSADCASSTFSLSALVNVPGNWVTNFSQNSLNVAPGATGSTNLFVTSPTTATVGSINNVIVRAANTANSSFSGFKIVNYGVLAPGTVPTPSPTPTPIPTPTPTPSPLTDTDGDGCSDSQELGLNEQQGGRRDPHNPYDYFDTPPKDKRITASDILKVVLRYGTFQNGGPNAEGLIYDAAFDRTFQGPDPWDLGAGDGVINASDIQLMIVQFGHSCL